MVAVQESCKQVNTHLYTAGLIGNILRGFFLTTKKTVSKSSTYLVR